MVINFYNCSDEHKRVTKTLGTAIITADGEAVPGCSVRAPRIRVSVTPANLKLINYAHIPDYGRYYYVGSPTWLGGGIFEYNLVEDPLMSFDASIRSSYAYVMRSSDSTQANYNIIDNQYPVEAKPTSSVNQSNVEAGSFTGQTWSRSENAWQSTANTSLQYVVCFRAKFLVISDPGGPHDNQRYVDSKGLYYLVFNLDELLDFLTIAFASSPLSPSAGDFIVDIYWLPFTLDYTQPYTFSSIVFTTDVGEQTAIPSGFPIRFLKTINMTYKFEVPITSTGTYKDAQPYKKMSVLFQPFGNIELDEGWLYGQETVTFVVQTNTLSGYATLWYHKGTIATGDITGTEKRYLASACIKISTAMSGSGAAGQSFMQTMLPAANKTLMPIAMAGIGALGGVGAAVLAGTVAASEAAINYRSAGSVIAGNTNTLVSRRPLVVSIKYDHVTSVPAMYGYLCHKRLQLSTLSGTGFCKCGEVDLELPGAYAEEYDEVERWLQQGVYL